MNHIEFTVYKIEEEDDKFYTFVLGSPVYNDSMIVTVPKRYCIVEVREEETIVLINEWFFERTCLLLFKSLKLLI